MARYRNDLEDERDFYAREDRLHRERSSNYHSPYAQRERRFEGNWRGEFGRGRYGERAEYERDEPRYGDYSQREEGYWPSREDSGYRARWREDFRPARSRLRCRDIMTRDLVVATRDTTLREVAMMMRDEDTGVIPVVDNELTTGNGRAEQEPRRYAGNNTYGQLIGLITDRDIVMRAVAEDKDCRTARAEEVMSTDIYSAKPNDRIVDVIRKMGDRQVRRIPVVGDIGQLKGIISMADVALEVNADHELADALEDISKESSFWSRLFN